MPARTIAQAMAADTPGLFKRQLLAQRVTTDAHIKAVFLAPACGIEHFAYVRMCACVQACMSVHVYFACFQ